MTRANVPKSPTMRNTSLLILLLLCNILYAGDIDINGRQCPSDTLEHYQVGPGTTYTRFNVTIGSTLHKLYLLTVDLTDPNVKIEENPGQGRLGTTEAMTRTHQRIDSAGHRPVGSVNCNFWVVSSQNTGHNEGLLNQPFAGTAKDGVLITEPDDWNYAYNADGSIVHGDRGFVMIDRAGRALIRNMQWNGRVIKGTKSYAIRDCNRTRVNPNASEITLFNRYIGVPTRLIPDTAVEIVFEPADGGEWRINDTMTCVVTAVNHTGGTQLSGNTGVLQARGAGKTRLLKCAQAVGDTFCLNLGMYSTSLNDASAPGNDSVTPHIMQMVTGNCLVMENGVINSRNTNEDYNNRNYPRTMIACNNEGTRLWMLVSEKPGNYTAEMCAILRHDGATWAAGMDGGGSAQMNLLGNIVNTTTEGTPRGVSNSLFVVSTAPDDATAASLVYMQNAMQTVPSYSSYTPSFRFYNQYGVYLGTEYADYTLTCEPASLGTISDDGHTFTAAQTDGRGRLIATLPGGFRAEQEIKVVDAPVRFLHKTMTIDSRECELEAVALAGGERYRISGDALTWTVEKSDIAEVSNGIARGLRNGTTEVYCSIGIYADTMQLNVLIPSAAEVLHTAVDSTWEAKGLGTAAWTDNDKCAFSFTTIRGAYISFTGDAELPGIPDSVDFCLSSTADIKSARFDFFTACGNALSLTKTESSTDTEGRLHYMLCPLTVDADNIAEYPLHLTKAHFILNGVTSGTGYSMTMHGITLFYHNYVADGLDNMPETDNGIRKILQPDGTFFIEKNGTRYNAAGVVIK